MAKATKKSSKGQPSDRTVPVQHAWHIVSATGADHTVTAESCDHYDGVLAFSNYTREGEDTRNLVVRAFAPGRWVECELVKIDDVHEGGSV
jgi:hypothetical protein